LDLTTLCPGLHSSDWLTSIACAIVDYVLADDDQSLAVKVPFRLQLLDIIPVILGQLG
jgi:hypothetical protein